MAGKQKKNRFHRILCHPGPALSIKDLGLLSVLTPDQSTHIMQHYAFAFHHTTQQHNITTTTSQHHNNTLLSFWAWDKTKPDKSRQSYVRLDQGTASVKPWKEWSARSVAVCSFVDKIMELTVVSQQFCENIHCISDTTIDSYYPFKYLDISCTCT